MYCEAEINVFKMKIDFLFEIRELIGNSKEISCLGFATITLRIQCSDLHKFLFITLV